MLCNSLNAATSVELFSGVSAPIWPTRKIVSRISPPFGQIQIPYSSLSVSNILKAELFSGCSAVTAFEGDFVISSKGKWAIFCRKSIAKLRVRSISAATPPVRSISFNR